MEIKWFVNEIEKLKEQEIDKLVLLIEKATKERLIKWEPRRYTHYYTSPSDVDHYQEHNARRVYKKKKYYGFTITLNYVGGPPAGSIGFGTVILGYPDLRIKYISIYIEIAKCEIDGGLLLIDGLSSKFKSFKIAREKYPIILEMLKLPLWLVKDGFEI